MRSSSSLKVNVLANYAGQLYVAGINLALLPKQVRLLGAEAYGLVGFFAVLSGWLQLLDIGLSATLARETTKYRAGALDKSTYRSLLMVLEALFACLGLVLGAAVLAAAGPISRTWLQPKAISSATVAQAVAMMGFVFAFRWQASLSRSVLLGIEHQVAVNVISVLAATLRSVGVLVALRWVEPTPRVFFLFQGAVAALELVVLRWSVRHALAFDRTVKTIWSLAPLRRVASFSLRVAFASLVWVLVSQLDKLLLSSLLPLADYGWFSLAVTAAGGISLIAAPIGQAVQPRLTYLLAEGSDAAFRSTYGDATQLLSALALTSSFLLAAVARPLLWAWTGNALLADHAAPVLALYAVGNGLLSVVAMTYYLQVAWGDLNLHLKGNLVFAAILVPGVAFATSRGGMFGAGIAWCAANLGFFLIWTAVVHRRFLRGFHVRWLMLDATLPCLVGLTPTLGVAFVPWQLLSRLQTAMAIAGIGAAAVGSSLLVTRPVRRLTLRFRSQLRGHAPRANNW